MSEKEKLRAAFVAGVAYGDFMSENGTNWTDSYLQELKAEALRRYPDTLAEGGAGMICTECGWTGEGGAIEYSDGKRYHFRANIQRGKIAPVMCCGEIEDDLKARDRIEGEHEGEAAEWRLRKPAERAEGGKR